jgi:plasmid stabilization system protein ParE
MDRDQDQYWDEIDDFLDRRQSSDKRKAFEKRMQQTAGLAADVKLQTSLRNGIAYGNREAFKDRLRLIQQETKGSQGKVVAMPAQRGKWKNWLSVAAVLAIATLGVLFWTQQSTIDQQALFAANYTPYALDLTQRGEELPDQLARLDASYSAGDFASAATLLDQALENDPSNASLALAKAIADWENDKPDTAQQQLEALFDHPLLKDQAYWYASLFALQKGQTEKAKAYLKEIKADSGSLYQQAINLLAQLN